MASRAGSARKLANLFSYAPSATAAPPRTVAQTKRITWYGRRGQVENAVEAFEQMTHRTQVSYNAMLSVFVDAGRIDSALQLFDEMPQKNPTSYTSMISGLSRAGLVAKARRIFDGIPAFNQNVFSWTAMLCCYTQNNEPMEAWKLFADLFGDFVELNILPNSHTFSILVKACGSIRSIVAARQVHSLIVKLLDEEVEDSVFVKNALIDVNAKLGSLVDAEVIFNRMKSKDLGTWNTMMDGYVHHLMIDKAFEIFNYMEEKDSLSWNIVMSGLLENRRGEDALRLFLCFLRSAGQDTKPNSSTYTIVLAACVTLTMLEFGRQIHLHVLKNGFYPNNVFISNSLITMYANFGLLEEMKRVFYETPEKDIVSWNSVIQGLGQNGCGREALKLAEKALGSKKHNQNTFIAILTSCSHGGLVDEGMEYFSFMSKVYGIDPTLDHYICVVDMLGRAGKLEEAYDLLRKMPFDVNSAAWGALLNACLIHGDCNLGRIASNELLALKSSDVRGYLALSNIYTRTGKIEESWRLLDLMQDKDLRKEPACSWVVNK